MNTSDPIAVTLMASRDKRITILIAIAQRLTGELMSRFLSAHQYEVINCNPTGSDALQLIERHRPDVALLDAELEGMEGLKIARLVGSVGGTTACILYTSSHKAKYLIESLKLKLPGLLCSGCGLEELSVCISEVLAKRQYITPLMLESLQQTGPRLAGRSTGNLHLLTTREREILSLISQYKTNGQIAKSLFISPATVNNHRARIMEKLDLQGRHGLLEYAVSVRDTISG